MLSRCFCCKSICSSNHMISTDIPMKSIGVSFCIFVPFLFSSCIGSSSPSSTLLGIAPQDEQFYKTEVIECRDGSKNISRAHLNDDFCDCPDGTDEPGTSACPRGKFYCPNAGHIPISLFSSRVNDGICDCCDGSDEYDGRVKCPNTCWEAGKVAIDRLEKEIATHREGLPIRERKLERAKRAFAHDTAALPRLKIEEKTLTKLVRRLEVRKERIEKAERKERLRKAYSNTKEITNEEDRKKDEEKGTSEANKFDLMEAAQNQHEKEMSREELGRLVASRWTGEATDDQDKQTDTSEGKLEETDKAPQSEDNDGRAEEPEEDTQNEDENEDDDPHNPDLEHPNDSDIATLSSPSWWANILESIRDILEAVNLFPTPVNILDGDRIRQEFDDSSARLGDVKSNILSLTKKLEYDFGAENEFYSLYDRCFETKQNTYVYKVCPFKQASQEEGRTTTWLGSWNMFENGYSAMLFSNGDACWNGPARSLKVILRCGLKTVLSDINEPSRCEYKASMSTPILCREDRLKELERELESIKEEKPQGHDDLVPKGER